MAKKQREDVRTGALIRQEEEAAIRDWLTRIMQCRQQHEREAELLKLVQQAVKDEDLVGVVREVVRRGHLIVELQNVRTRLQRMGFRQAHWHKGNPGLVGHAHRGGERPHYHVGVRGYWWNLPRK